eukprot:scaffold6954_cov201-Skeletonema_dohrnii-CCMP3373.AAC.4
MYDKILTLPTDEAYHQAYLTSLTPSTSSHPFCLKLSVYIIGYARGAEFGEKSCEGQYVTDLLWGLKVVMLHTVALLILQIPIFAPHTSSPSSIYLASIWVCGVWCLIS